MRIVPLILSALLAAQAAVASFSNFTVYRELGAAVGYHQWAEADRDFDFLTSKEVGLDMHAEARSPDVSPVDDALVKSSQSIRGSASQDRISLSGVLRGEVVYSKGQPLGRYGSYIHVQFQSDEYFYAEFSYDLGYERKSPNAENPFAYMLIEGGDPYSPVWAYRFVRANGEYNVYGYPKSAAGRQRALMPPGTYHIHLDARTLYRSRACNSRASFSFVAQKHSFPDSEPTVQTLSPLLQIPAAGSQNKTLLVLMGKADRSDFAGITGFEFIDPTAYQPAVEILHSSGFFADNDPRFGFAIEDPMPLFEYRYRAFLQLNETKIYGEWVTYKRPWPHTEVSTSAGIVKLALPTVPRHSYQLEEADGLGDAWKPLSGQSFVGDGTTKEISVPMSATSKFYRYAVEPLVSQPD